MLFNDKPHTFTTEPTSSLGYTENGGGVYYETTYRGKTEWKRDNFNDDRVFKNTEKLTFKEILDHEETYNFDINKDGSVGDVVAEVIGYGINSQTTGIDKDSYSFLNPELPSVILNNGNALTFFALINNTIPDPGINDSFYMKLKIKMENI